MNIIPYAEIGITTNFSFLRGGSDPRDYVRQASELHLPVIGIADHNTLAGVVRAYKELGNPELQHTPKLLIGSRLVFIDGTPDILVYPRDRDAYGRLCQLLTRGKRGDDTQQNREGRVSSRARRSPGIRRGPASGANAAASLRHGKSAWGSRPVKT